ncbi:hypothetical protein M422DRAFT_244888 [Sphaerobolus stellatus SS14]|nr:hypothetical protein M422DRAFT_244888 [Sphaerobolus stellatus SS14]
MSSIELEPARLSRTLSLNQGERPSSSRPSSSHQRANVINVDDEDEVQILSEPPRQRRRLNNDRPEVVVLDDDDDEIVFQGRRFPPRPNRNNSASFVGDDDEPGPSRPTGARQTRAERRGGRASAASFRIFSPPPPPRQHHPIPPVPAVPPPVIAGPMPFAILPPARNNEHERNRVPFDEPPQPRAGPSNAGNRQPRAGIGLGGGLISQGIHRPRVAAGPIHPADGENYNRPNWAEQIRRLGRIVAQYVGNRPRRTPDDLFGDDLFGDTFEDAMDIPEDQQNFLNIITRGPFARRDVALGIGREYQKSMTHPGRPGPGWTFDFGPQEGEEGKEAEETLVCARCLDPLIANAEGLVDATAKQRKERRVWGLRCGHVLDGHCLMGLSFPAGAQMELAEGKQEVAVPSPAKSKGKGKGKGKARAPPREEVHAEADQPFEDYIEIIHMPSEQPVSENANASISSRLRSRDGPSTSTSSSADAPPSTSPRRSTRTAATPSSSAFTMSELSHPTLPSAGVASTPRTRQPVRRAGGKRKRKGGKTGPDGEEVVDNRYHWPCPVAGCCKVHESIEVNGIWKADPDRGAVMMFV